MLMTVIIIVRACNGVRFERVCIRFQRVIQTKKACANSVDLVILPFLTLAFRMDYSLDHDGACHCTTATATLCQLVVILFYLLGRF